MRETARLSHRNLQVHFASLHWTRFQIMQRKTTANKCEGGLMGANYLTTQLQESLEVHSHGKPNAHTGPQPDMMWRTNAVEEEQLTTHC